MSNKDKRPTAKELTDTDLEKVSAAADMSAHSSTVANTSPETTEGKGLLSHELTHISQQGTSKGAPAKK